MSNDFTSDAGARRGYHHGNLKEALIAAALELIRDRGAAGFTFAEAARHAGVSAAAPYRHYRDRDTLLADVARRGFERFSERLAAAWRNGEPTPMQGLLRAGRAYLDFARNEPAYYAAMFEAGISLAAFPETRTAGDHAFAVLRTCCEGVIATIPAPRRPPAMMVALHVWSTAHGVASLFARGDTSRRPLPMPAEDLLEAGVLIYCDGLGVPR
jgi:AcrR family transcriptional regulator